MAELKVECCVKSWLVSCPSSGHLGSKELWLRTPAEQFWSGLLVFKLWPVGKQTARALPLPLGLGQSELLWLRPFSLPCCNFHQQKLFLWPPLLLGQTVLWGQFLFSLLCTNGSLILKTSWGAESSFWVLFLCYKQQWQQLAAPLPQGSCLSPLFPLVSPWRSLLWQVQEAPSGCLGSIRWGQRASW